MSNNTKGGIIDPNGTNVPVQLSKSLVNRSIELWVYHMKLDKIIVPNYLRPIFINMNFLQLDNTVINFLKLSSKIK